LLGVAESTLSLPLNEKDKLLSRNAQLFLKSSQFSAQNSGLFLQRPQNEKHREQQLHLQVQRHKFKEEIGSFFGVRSFAKKRRFSPRFSAKKIMFKYLSMSSDYYVTYNPCFG
jgi:hypothetical protein